MKGSDNTKCPFLIKICTKCKRILVAYEGNFRPRKDGKYGFRAECKRCIEQYEKQYREKNKKEISKKDKERYEKNKIVKLKKAKEYNESHKEEKKRYNQEYYKNNKEKIKKYNKKYRQENKKRISEYNKQYRIENIDKLLEYSKEYYKNNKEKSSEYYRKYRKENPEICFNNDTSKRLRKENQGRGITKEQWLEMMDFFNWRCAYSDIILNKDNRSIDHIMPLSRGGEHEPWNCVPMEKYLNMNKHANNMEDWYIQQEFFDIDRLLKIYEWIEYAWNKWGNK